MNRAIPYQEFPDSPPVFLTQQGGRIAREWFPVIELGREDLDNAEFNAEGVSDEVMSLIATAMGNYIWPTLADVWTDKLTELCNHHHIPHKEEPEEEYEDE